MHMAQIVEISLRIPSLRIRREDTDALETINNSDIRFSKQIEVESIPKAGVVLTMAIRLPMATAACISVAT